MSTLFPTAAFGRLDARMRGPRSPVGIRPVVWRASGWRPVRGGGRRAPRGRVGADGCAVVRGERRTGPEVGPRVSGGRHAIPAGEPARRPGAGGSGRSANGRRAGAIPAVGPRMPRNGGAVRGTLASGAGRGRFRPGRGRRRPARFRMAVGDLTPGRVPPAGGTGFQDRPETKTKNNV